MTNGKHSTTGSPLAAFCCGSVTEVSADERILKPELPVSTRTPSIAWHVDVPGTHTVTVANAPFAYGEPTLAAGPEFTTIGATFAPDVTIVCVCPGLLVVVLLLPPPPHATENAQLKPAVNVRKLLSPIIGYPRP